jgi:hypothetical protein
MRILGFSERWPKLHQELPVEERPLFTTFRFPRSDKDWAVGEIVKVVYQPRRKGGGDFLGLAAILRKFPIDIYGSGPMDGLTNKEAVDDGFVDKYDMRHWMERHYPFRRLWREPMNKLTLEWREEAK